MFNGLMSCQSAFLNQSSRQPPACIDATLAQHQADCPTTSNAMAEYMESSHPTS